MYQRVIPRDLFNEAKLLKCLGHVCLLASSSGQGYLETELLGPKDGYNEGFRVEQDENTGDIFVENFFLLARVPFCEEVAEINFYHPLYDMSNFPLMFECVVLDEENRRGKVFTEKGVVHEDFRQMILKANGVDICPERA